MDSIDDDFGDLYADVEVQVQSAINNVPEFTKLYTKPEPENDNNNNNESPNLKSNPGPEENLISESTWKASSFEGNDESDSEDELKIVLNDEDCKRFPVNAGGGDEDEDEEGIHRVVKDGSKLNSNNNAHGYNFPYSQYKYIRSRGSTLPSNSRVNGSAKGFREENGFDQHKGSNSGQIASIRVGAVANSVVPQCAYGFSLLWYRPIMDVNIDTCEEKPWNYPGANTSDFFNFGFNEESWKTYCNSLDQYRERTFMRARFSVLDQAYEFGFQCEKVGRVARDQDIMHVGSSSKFSDRGERPLKLPKGRAIEVEGRISERQPSMDARYPRFRDSDVVIQINVQDSVEDFSGSGHGQELGHIDSNSSGHDTSINGNLELDRKREDYSCGDASDDKLSADSVEKDVRNLDTTSAFGRCPESMSASNQIPLGSDSHGNGKTSECDEYHHRDVNAHTSEATETSKKVEELVGRSMRKSDSCLIEAELSLGDQNQFSLSPSCSGSYSEQSKDSVHSDPVKICTLLRRSAPNSGTEFQDSVTSDHKNSLSNGFKPKRGDEKYYSRHRSPSEEDWKHHRGRHRRVTERKIYPESDDDASPVSNGKGDGKSYLRSGPVKEKRKHCHGVFFSTSEQKIHHESGAYTSPMSDAEDLYDKDYKSVDRSRQKQRLRDFGYHNAEDLSYDRETKISLGYGSERFIDDHVPAVHSKNRCSRYHQSSKDQMDPCGRKKWDEREYCLERSARIDNEDDMGRNWHHYKKGFSKEEKIPLVYGKSRQLAPEYSSTFKERGTKWRSKNDKLRSGNRFDHYRSLPYNQLDDFMGEKCGRTVPFTDRKRDSLDRIYERGLPFFGSEMKISIQGGRCGDSPGLLDRSWPLEVENGYRRRTGHRSSISRSHRQFYPPSGGRWRDTMSSIDDVYDYKVNEKYGRLRRRICHEEQRDSGWFDIYDDTDNTKDSIMDRNDPIYLGRRRHSWQSKVLHRMEGELIARYRDNECFAEKALFSYDEQITMHERIHAKCESDCDGILIDDAQLKHNRDKLIRDGSSAKCVNRNYTVLRCRDTVDLIVGEGKSSGGRSNGRSLMCNGRLEKMELKFASEQTTSKDFHESNRGKFVRTGIPKVLSDKNTEKWLNKYDFTERNEDSDIEEGQIIMEEPDMENHLEKKHVSKITVPTRNVKKRILCIENASNENNDVREYDKQHILETLAKMEKRRERFKDPITFKTEADMNTKSQADLMVDRTETKQQRPARKRRWGGS